MATGSQDLTITQPAEREVRIERTFDAPPELVWRALTEPELLARWWARGNPMTVERFEIRPGGHWRFVEHASDGDFGFEGRFREIEPPKMLSQTFEYDGQPGHVSLDTVVLLGLGEQTRLIATSLFMTIEDKDAMMAEGVPAGLSQSYAALDEVLVSLREGPA